MNNNNWTRQKKEICVGSKAAKEIKALQKEYSRFNDAYMALKWLLERDCERLGLSKGRIHLHKQLGDCHNNIPDIIVIFTFDDIKIDVISLQAKEAT